MKLKICTYVDIVQFYQDYFSDRKRKDSKFSYEIWASELGFKSRTFMKLIASGKRQTTNKLIDIFAEKNSFSEAEKKHLIHLSLFQKSKTDLQKKIHFEAVLQTLDSSSSVTLIQNYVEFISSPSLPILQLVLAFKNVHTSEKNLALITDQTLKQIKSDLKKLEKLGIAYNENGQWKSKYYSFKVPDEVQSKTLKKYHSNNLKEAQTIIEQDHLQRRFRTIMFALSDHSFGELTEEVEAFLAKIKNKYNTVKSKTDRIYKLNLQTYPMTRSLV